MLARCCIATKTFSVAIRNSPQAKELKDRVRSNWLVAPGAMTSRGVAVGIRGTWRLCNKGLGGAVDVDWRGAQGLPTKGPASRVGGNCWSRGQKVRLLLRSAVVESRPSWAPPIRCRYFLRRWRVCLPVVMLIASAGHLKESEKGVPAYIRSAAVRTRQALPVTQHRSARQRQTAAHRPAHDGRGGSWSIVASPEMLPTQGPSNRQRFGAVLGRTDPASTVLSTSPSWVSTIL